MINAIARIATNANVTVTTTQRRQGNSTHIQPNNSSIIAPHSAASAKSPPWISSAEQRCIVGLARQIELVR